QSSLLTFFHSAAVPPKKDTYRPPAPDPRWAPSGSVAHAPSHSDWRSGLRPPLQQVERPGSGPVSLLPFAAAVEQLGRQRLTRRARVVGGGEIEARWRVPA